MSDADRVALAYVAESTWGTTPATPTLQAVRFTSESLSQDSKINASDEIRDDRQVAGAYRANADAKGDINFELSYGSFDDFLLAALQSAGWSTVRTATGSIAAAASGNTYTLSAAFSNFAVGQWVYASGFANAANNGFSKITAKDNNSITVTGKTLVNETVSATVVMGAQILNGVTQKSFSIERTYSDVASTFAVYTGMTPNGLDLNIKADEIITGAFHFMGKLETSGTSTIASSLTDVNDNKVVNAVDNVIALMKNLTSHPSTEFSLSLTNNLRNRLQIGTLGPASIGSGKCMVTGKLMAYFSSNAQLAEYLAFTTVSLTFIVTDEDGNSYVIELPSVKLSLGTRSTGGQNTDVMAELSFMTIRDEDEDVTIRIARFAAA